MISMVNRNAHHRGEYRKRNTLGPKAIEAYRFIVDYTIKQEYPPTFLEIAQHLGIAKSGAARYIELLVQHEYLTRGNGNRTLRITGKRPEWY